MASSNISARTIGFITLIAAALVIVSVFLSWYHYSATLFLESSTDCSGLDMKDMDIDDWQKNIPLIALVLGAVAAFLEFLDIFMPKMLGKFASIIVTLISVGIVVVCAIYLTWDMFGTGIDLGPIVNAKTEVGIGGYLALAGGALMLLLGLVQMINSYGKKH